MNVEGTATELVAEVRAECAAPPEGARPASLEVPRATMASTDLASPLSRVAASTTTQHVSKASLTRSESEAASSSGPSPGGPRGRRGRRGSFQSLRESIGRCSFEVAHRVMAPMRRRSVRDRTELPPEVRQGGAERRRSLKFGVPKLPSDYMNPVIKVGEKTIKHGQVANALTTPVHSAKITLKHAQPGRNGRLGRAAARHHGLHRGQLLLPGCHPHPGGAAEPYSLLSAACMLPPARPDVRAFTPRRQLLQYSIIATLVFGIINMCWHALHTHLWVQLLHLDRAIFLILPPAFSALLVVVTLTISWRKVCRRRCC